MILLYAILAALIMIGGVGIGLMIAYGANLVIRTLM